MIHHVLQNFGAEHELKGAVWKWQFGNRPGSRLMPPVLVNGEVGRRIEIHVYKMRQSGQCVQPIEIQHIATAGIQARAAGWSVRQQLPENWLLDDGPCFIDIRGLQEARQPRG